MGARRRESSLVISEIVPQKKLKVHRKCSDFILQAATPAAGEPKRARNDADACVWEMMK
jgi:hypothetical protein